MNLTELETELNKIDLQKFNGVHISNGTIIDAKEFVSTHLSFFKANSKNETFKPYYDRLLEFYNKIKEN